MRPPVSCGQGAVKRSKALMPPGAARAVQVLKVNIGHDAVIWINAIEGDASGDTACVATTSGLPESSHAFMHDISALEAHDIVLYR